MNMRNFFRKLESAKTKVLALKFANYVIGACVAIVFARYLGAEGYGAYAFVYAIVLILVLPTGVGLPDLVLRETTRARMAQDDAAKWRLWRWATLAIVLGTLAVIVVVFLVTSLVGYGAAEPTLFWLGMVLVPLIAAGAVRASALQALDRPFAAQFPQMVLRQALLLGIFLFVAITAITGTPTPVTAMASNVAGAAIAFIIGTVLLLRASSPVDRSRNIRDAPHHQWLTSAFLMGAGRGGQVLNSNLDLILLGILATAVDVGLYKAVVVMGTTALFAVNAIELAIMPRVAFLAGSGDMQKLAISARRAACQILAFGMVILLFLVVAGHFLLGLAFGAEYQQGYTVLLIVGVAKASFFVFGPVRPLLAMTGHEARIPPVMLQAVALNAVVCIVLIPLVGYYGAAIAMLVSSWFWNIRLFRIVKACTGIDLSPFSRGTECDRGQD
ncbi:MAG: oligosaccharide flippase family protein [Pararhodobacter sp.]|nr:oligosaccharide flippase family protein [Pararhodobacter sp.]